MKFLTSIAVAVNIILASSLVSAAAPILTIRNDVAGNSSSPGLYGIMYEDINESLYGQALRNWNFQANDTGGAASLEFWNPIGSSSSASIQLDTSVGLSTVNSNSLRLDIFSVASGRVGFANEGWWGLRVQPNEAYKASFFAKTAEGFSKPLNISLESASGQVLASAVVSGLSGDFRKYSIELKSEVESTTIDNVFAVSFDSKEAEGKSVWFQDRENGIRKDIAETLAGFKPKFFRFPGGNNLEGQWIDARWKWNETIGPLEERKDRVGDCSYWNTNGQGLLDYMYLEFYGFRPTNKLIATDLGMKPILGVYAGYSLDGSSMPEAQLGPYIEEAMNELEYLLGDTSTIYGKFREQHGHKDPFDIPYIEIGNGDFFSTTYNYPYAAFYDASTAKYPNIPIIQTTIQSSRPHELLDDHYYLTTADMIDRFKLYDNYERTVNGSSIFVGEFGTNTKGCCGTSPAGFEAALADGVFITGLERNSDVVKMYSEHPIDTMLQVDAEGHGFGPLYWVAGSNKGKNQIYIKAVNVGNAGIDLDDENTRESPNTVTPNTATFCHRLGLEPEIIPAP